MKLKQFYISIFLLLITLVASSQTDYYENDSIIITLKDFVGEPQWQKSYDTINWINIIGETKDSILFIADSSTLFRAKVVHGICNFFSDTVFINVEIKIIPKVTTSIITSITINSAISGGNVIDDGGEPIITRGVCWNTTGNPTISDSTTSDSIGAGIFISSITGLEMDSIYYVRAYASNSIGTSYGAEIAFKTLIMGIPCPNAPSLTDIEGNVYSTVQIGNQCWMAENLKTTKYNDSTDIPLTTDNSAWNNLTTASYCWYNNDSAAIAQTYGAHYNWYAVDSSFLCPLGWHVPTDAEWTILTDYLGGETVSGGKLKEIGTTHWISPNTGATNETGFNALPSSHRNPDGDFSNGIGYHTMWWSNNEGSPPSSDWFRSLEWNDSEIGRMRAQKNFGYSVRCLKD